MLPPDDPNPEAPKPIVKKSRRTLIPLLKTKIAIYAGSKVADALAVVSGDMKIYQAVKLTQVLEAVYKQGKRDGAREVVEAIDAAKEKISYRNPGQPKKRKP